MREESLTALKKSKETVQTKIPGLEKKVSINHGSPQKKKKTPKKNSAFHSACILTSTTHQQKNPTVASFFSFQITKMSSENKDLPVLTSRLQEARSELISLENSVAIEEARLSDFKRETVREGLSLRLGAMLELAEKMTIVCEFGKMLTAEVPLERTAPGAARTAYCAAQKTQAVVEEAQRCLTEVVFNPNASAGTLNHESSSSELPSSQSPTSDSQQPMTPRQTQQPLTDVSQGLPMELPPLYFSEAGAENPIKPSATTTSPSNIMYSAHPNHQATPLDNYSSLPYVSESEAPPHSYASAQTSFTNPEFGPSPPLPPSLTPGTFASRLSNNRHPSDVSGEAQERSPYLNNVVYLRGTNGAPPSAGLSNPAESIVSPTSLYSPPSSATPSERLARPPNRYSQPTGPSSPHQYPSSLTSAELLAKTSSGSGRGESDETVANNKSRYSPHPRDPSIASGVSGLPASEGRTTNAGAFRRAGANQVATPPGSQARSIGSTQALLATDEALSTGASTLVQPLQINKRDTSSTLDQR
jgi:hypothetical protein